MAAVARVEELAHACVARRRVGRHSGQRRRPRRARDHAKVALPAGRYGDHLDRIDVRERGRLTPKRSGEAGNDIEVVALHLDEHALRVVAHEPAETTTARDAVDRRAKADALHRSANADGAPHAR